MINNYVVGGFILLMLLSILSSLASGLYYLLTSERDGGSTKTVTALKFRFGLSIALFLILFVGMATGVLKPHSFSTFNKAISTK